MIRQCHHRDIEILYSIINEAAQKYKGVIPDDCWKIPYMPEDELKHEIDEGVVFWGFEVEGELIGVMGIQHIQDVTLIRHAYVRPAQQLPADRSPDANRHLGRCRLGDSFL
jgi:hypothetical protein